VIKMKDNCFRWLETWDCWNMCSGD